LEAFVYSIAHDLRARARAMTGYAQLLVADHSAGLGAAAQHMLERIRSSSEFLDRLLVDLLAYGRAARAEMELTPVELRKAWKSALLQCTSQIEQSQALIETVEPLPTVLAHEATLGQILANLLSNAEVRRTRCSAARPFSSRGRGQLRSSWVEDNGIGIPAEQHERVFRVFERLHGSRYVGTGIGLSIVRKGIERMGGRMGLESKPGHGSRFWVELAKAE
jgi:signal transduction histidine kinase